MTRSRHRYTDKELTPMDRHYPLQDAIERFGLYQRAAGRAKGTLERYRYTFQIFEQFLSATGRKPSSKVLTTETMEAFATYLRETPIRPQHGLTKRAESGIHAHLRDMRAFCRWLEGEGLLERSVRFPMPTVPKRLVRVLTDEELQRLWQSRYLAGHSKLAIRNRALIALMLDTGLRREETANITLAELNMTRRTVVVIGKGNKQRRVYFSPGVKELLKEFLAIRGVDDEPLFHLSAQGIRSMFYRIRQDVGLEHFHPHMLRRQFATTLHKNRISPEEISLLMGHEDFNTTRRYLSINDDDLHQAHQRASPFDTLLGEDDPPAPKRRTRYTA